MVVPYGFGVSDFIGVGQLASKIYSSCKAAPEVFGNISTELESLRCVLGEAVDSQLSHPLPPRREARLKTIMEGCISVLGDLQFIVQRYKSLGTDDKSSWDRLRLGGEDISEIRSRLSLNITLLTAFRSFVIATPSLENPLLPTPELESWQWVFDLSGPEGVATPQRMVSPVSDGRLTTESNATTLVQLQPPSKTKSKSWFASLATFFSGKNPLISAIDRKNLDKALEFLKDSSTGIVFDQQLLDHAFWSAARFPSVPLMEALISKGANVDANRDEKTVLWNAVSAQNEDGVRFLLSQNVNLEFDHLSPNFIPLRAALRSDSMMSLLARNGVQLDGEYQGPPSYRLNILQEAITLGRESIIRILLDNGADVDACSSSHGTALMIALSMGRESIAKLLIQRGADVNRTRPASESCPYTNPIEAAILGREPSLLQLLFQAGAVTDMPQAMRFAQARSDYHLKPGVASQYGYDYKGTGDLYKVMVMLAQRDLRYVCFFKKGDDEEMKKEGIRRMMNELCG